MCEGGSGCGLTDVHGKRNKDQLFESLADKVIPIIVSKQFQQIFLYDPLLNIQWRKFHVSGSNFSQLLDMTSFFNKNAREKMIL